MAKRKDEQALEYSREAAEVEGVSIPPNSVAAAEAVGEIKSYHRHMTTHIIVDSCGDFAPEVARRLQVEVIPFPYRIGDDEYLDDLWESVSAHDFYESLRAGTHATTSAVTPGRYYEVFERAAEKGMPTIYLGFTRGLSSSIEAAHQAADMIAEKYPDFELYVLDNLCPSAAA